MSEVKNNRTWSFFGPDFQQKVIWQLLVEPEFAKDILPKIAVEYFEDPYLKRLFIIMLEYYNEYDRVPNLQNKSIEEAIYKYKSPTNEIEGQVLMGKVDQVKLWNERVINKNQLYDGDIVRENIFDFIKQQEYRKLAEHIIEKVKDGGIKQKAFNYEAGEKFNKIYHIGDDEDYGSDVIDDIDHALSDEFRDTIPTGILVIDQVTENGLGRGEIGLVLAPSGIGKTTLLTKIANSAFNQKKKVLQIIFEDTVKQVQRKHYTLWSGIAQSEIKNNKDMVKERVLKHVNGIKEQGGKIDIIRMSQEDTTMHDIRNWINRQFKKFGYKYDIIVLDYLDCLEPNKRVTDLLAAELSIVKSFEAMAAELDIPCWSAIQANRGGFNVDFVNAENTGGNIKRVQKSHFVMSIAKPAKAENDNIANIKIIKARFAKDGHEFEHCIFNNDTLEIRITDNKYASGVIVKKVDDTDIDKLAEKANDISGFNHGIIGEAVFDSGPTVADLNKDIVVNTDFEKQTEATNEPVREPEATNEPVSEGINEGVSHKPPDISPPPENNSSPSHEPIPTETREPIGEIDPEAFFNEVCGKESEKPKDQWDRELEKRQKEHVVVQRE